MQPLFLLIDIDNTLYEYNETGFHHEMHDRIFGFAATKLGLTTAEAEQLSRRYYMNYGLSLYGYVKEYGVNAKEYSDYVHQCSYEKLHYNKPLVEMLRGMQHTTAEGATEEEKTEVEVGEEGVAGANSSSTTPSPQPSGVDHLYYFTNANRAHARRILDPQGLRPIFSRPRPAGSPVNEFHRSDDAAGFEEDVEWLGFSYEDQWRLTQPDCANKPMRRAYEAIYAAIDEQIAHDATLLETGAMLAATAPSAQEVNSSKRAHLKPENVVMVDDSLMNLDAPLELGWSAVWYAHDDQQLPAVTEGNAKAALYAAAVVSGHLQIIRNILELKDAVERIRAVNMAASA